MRATLPVFPLQTVLFPGLVLPLHIFEERYRSLVRDLTADTGTDAREFGVVTLRQGQEVASADGEGAPAEPVTAAQLYDVGCTADLRQVTELSDGRFDIVTVGRRRFRVLKVQSGTKPYLTAEVTWLPEPDVPDSAAEMLAPRVLAAFRGYLEALRPDNDTLEEAPDDPTVLSHLVAATTQLTVEERHSLLAAPDTVTRLRTELRLLIRETGLLARVRAVPVPLSDLARPASPN